MREYRMRIGKDLTRCVIRIVWLLSVVAATQSITSSEVYAGSVWIPEFLFTTGLASYSDDVHAEYTVESHPKFEGSFGLTRVNPERRLWMNLQAGFSHGSSTVRSGGDPFFDGFSGYEIDAEPADVSVSHFDVSFLIGASFKTGSDHWPKASTVIPYVGMGLGFVSFSDSYAGDALPSDPFGFGSERSKERSRMTGLGILGVRVMLGNQLGIFLEGRHYGQFNDSYDVYEDGDLREISRSCDDYLCIIEYEVVGEPENKTYSITELRVGLTFGIVRPKVIQAQ